MNWYAIHTRPRQETVAQRSLDREGVETFYPKLRRKRTIRRVRRWVTNSLFPSYIFACFDVTKSARLVRYANGVSNIVSFGGKPATVDEAIIESVRAHGDNDVVTILPPELRQGDRVTVQEGPLCGLEGIFERELSDSERVVILLQCIASRARVELSREQIEKISN